MNKVQKLEQLIARAAKATTRVHDRHPFMPDPAGYETPEGVLAPLTKAVAEYHGVGPEQWFFSGLCGGIGGVPIIQPADIARKLAAAGLERGAQQATDTFVEKTENNTLEYEYATYLSGIAVKDETKLAPGLRITPAVGSDGTNLVPLHVKSGTMDPHYPDPYNDGAIAISTWRSNLLFKKVEKEYAEEFKYLEDFKYSADCPVTEESLAQILTLVTGNHATAASSWPVIDPLEPYFAGFYMLSHTGWGIDRRDQFREAVQLGTNHIELAKELLTSKQAVELITGDLSVPIEYWAASKERRTKQPQSYAAASLRTAMETLFLDNEQGALTYRMKIRAAKLLSEDPAERRDISEKITRGYNTLSYAVHRGRSRPNDQQWVDEAQELTRKSILAILKRGAIPDWKSLELN